MTIDDLRRILAACAGEDENTGLAGGFGALSFTDLGYDSLAVMEIAARIKQEFRVTITDDEILELATPQALLVRVNGLRAAA